jgi:hypothetical protein
VLIEQAIFTSAHTGHGDGYQLLARSPGVTDRQARELAVWGPSHDALNIERDEQSSVNFHPLSCGTYCISKTVAMGQEHCGGGARIYTQFLLVPPAVLARFANNPFAVLRAAWAKGVLTVQELPPPVLEPFNLVGRAATVDEGLLAQLADQWGPSGVGRLISTAMTPGVQLLSGVRHCETLIGGLLQCFPVECRVELSFTTGLRFSPQRPFRLSPVSDDAAEQSRALRHEDVTLVDLASADMAETELCSWAAYVAEMIRHDNLPRLAAALQQQRPNLHLNELDNLGEQLLEELRHEPVIIGASSEESQPQQNLPSGSYRLFRTDRPQNMNSAESNADPHQPRTTSSLTQAPSLGFVAGTGEKIHALTDPAALELLEPLDDLVFDAVNGVAGAVENAAKLWSQLAARLPAATIAVLREQYLQYALTLWNAGQEQGVRNADKAIGALDVLAVLFKPE